MLGVPFLYSLQECRQNPPTADSTWTYQAAPSSMESLESSPGLVCPITQSLMHEPVIGTDGYTYERQAIEAWLLKHGRSPMTREPMAVSDLRPNRAVADQIMWLLEANPKAAASFAAEQPFPFPSSSSADVPHPSTTNTTAHTLKSQLKADLLQGSSSASPSAPVAPSSAHYFGGAAGAAPSTSHLWPPQPPGAEGGSPGPSAPPLPPNLAAPQQPSSAHQQPPLRETPQQHRQDRSGSGSLHHHHHHHHGKNKAASTNQQQQQRMDNHNNDPENLSVDFKTYGSAIKVKNDFKERRDLAEGGNYRGGVVVKPSKKNSSCELM